MQKALFLDRDGVINVEKEYLYKQEDFEFIEGVFDLCRYFAHKGYLLFVVTNQSGIAREYYTEEDFEKLTTWMLGEFEKEGITLSHVYHCPHYPKISGECSCRKPKPGMLLEAKEAFDLDMANSIMVGDKERDIEAGLNAGLQIAYFFDESKTQSTSKASHIVSSLKEIIDVDSQ